MSLRDAINRIQEIRRDNEWLSDVLTEALHSERQVPPMKFDDWLPTSRVPTLCPRAQVMASRMNLELTDTWDPQARWRADCGSALHHVFQELWLGPLKLLLGGWQCPRCAHKHGVDENGDAWPSTSIFCPDKCSKCERPWKRQDPFRFIEPHARDNPLKVRGRIDGLLRLPGYYPEIVDLKTTRFVGSEPKPWSVYRAPRQNDVKQLHWYLDSAQCSRGRIIYMDPSAKLIEDSMVEHKISFNPSMMHREKEKVRVLREALEDEGRPVPDCPYDRKFPYGDCACVEVESVWSGSRD